MYLKVLLVKKRAIEQMKKHRLMAENLTQVFRTLIPDLSIEHSGSAFLHWVGQLHLGTLTENLLKLKSEDLHVYTYLMSNHKDTIYKAKKLLGKLKSQNLPAPSVYIDHTYYHKQQQGVTEQHVHIKGSSPQQYFSRIYSRESGSNPFERQEEANKQYKKYLSRTRPLLAAVYEAIALTTYHHLQDAHGSTGT